MRANKLLLAAAGTGAAIVAARAVLRRRGLPSLRGQAVLITGGSRGLGLALARAFARQGCRVAICARDPVGLEAAEASLQGGGGVLAIQCDVTDRKQVEAAIEQVTLRFGAIDILVNNAGEIQVGPLESMTLEDFEHALQVMLWG